MTWEYIKGSEADFEGAPEWATHKIKCPFDTNFVNGVDVGCIGVTIENPNEQPWQLNASVNMLIIAERRKVDNLQSRVNDANLGGALKEMFDTVQRPAHYNQSDIECIDAIKASMTLAEFQSYLKGNVLKYLWRYRHKNGLEDVKKAQWYINRLAAELEESEKGAEQ